MSNASKEQTVNSTSTGNNLKDGAKLRPCEKVDRIQISAASRIDLNLRTKNLYNEKRKANR